MKDFYRVVIAGGGPSGLQCARTLSKAGIECVVLEGSSIPGEPNNSTAGTPMETISKFNIPPDVAKDFVDHIFMISPHNKAAWKKDDPNNPIGYVLDFRKLKLFLAEDAKSHGAEVSYGSQVEGVVLKPDKSVDGATYLKDGKTNMVKGKYFVDATASFGVMSSKVGLRKKSFGESGIGIEKIIRTTSLSKEFDHSMSFYFGSNYIPNGYAWVFSFGEGIYKVGVCRAITKKHTKEDLDEYLKDFIKFLNITDYQEIEEHGNSVFVNGGFRNNVYKNLIMVGDAASNFNPLLGEGIRHGMMSGQLAAETIIKAEESKGYKLDKYNNEIRKYRTNKWLLSYLFGKIIYKALSDKLLDLFVKRISRLKTKDVEALIIKYEYVKLLKVFL